MREQTVAMYCFLDDLLTTTRPVWARPADKRRHLSDAQVLTTALVAARYFGGNLVLGQRYMEQHWGQKSLDKSGFNRQLHALADTLAGLFATFGQLLKNLHTEARYVIDSFPVAVCHNTRIPRCKLLTGKAYHGRCASKRSWFYGFKVQVVATTDGIPVDYYIHAGSEADQTGLRALAPDLPEGSILYTDAGYTDYVGEDLFEEATGNRQQTARKKNSQRPHEPHENFLIQHFRKSIETCFSQLTARFPKQIHAVTAQGFFLKIVLFIFVHALDQAGI
ncbi:IS982 family transposase [Hymenobacter antarcticus]|uniref:Transposase DDE domain-containing protein n=1 Tax=Hymenobacter antarcticus TaxID=486270 RepID=A0ABP7R818_9BACT